MNFFGFVLLGFMASTHSFPSFDSILDQPTDRFSFAVISDTHIGESIDDYDFQENYSTKTLRAAVSFINNVSDALDIRFVLHTGDITSSAQEKQYRMARRIVDELRRPFIPVIGNHDIWTYDHEKEPTTPSGMCRYRSVDVTGDQLFREVFGDCYAHFRSQRAPVYNPDENVIILNMSSPPR